MSPNAHHHESNHPLNYSPRPAPSPLQAVVRAIPGVLAVLFVLAAIVVLAANVPAVGYALAMFAVAAIVVGVVALPIAFVHYVGDAL